MFVFFNLNWRFRFGFSRPMLRATVWISQRTVNDARFKALIEVSGKTTARKNVISLTEPTVEWIVDIEANCLTDGCDFLFCLRQKENFIKDRYYVVRILFLCYNEASFINSFFLWLMGASWGRVNENLCKWGWTLRIEMMIENRKTKASASVNEKQKKISFHIFSTWLEFFQELLRSNRNWNLMKFYLHSEMIFTELDSVDFWWLFINKSSIFMKDVLEFT